MKNYAIQFILYSEQTIPNMLPLVCDKTRPRQVVFLLTPLMNKNQDKFRRITEWVEGLGIKVTVKALEAFNFEAIQNRVSQLIDKYASAGSLALNATGGTKIMSFGAMEAFRQRGLDCFYIDSQNNQYLRLIQKFETIDLPQDLFTVSEYVQAVGFRLLSQQQPCVEDHQQEWIDMLLNDPKGLQKAVTTLNYFAGRIPQSRQGDAWVSTPINTGKYLDYKGFRHIVKRASELELLRLDGHALHFHDRAGWDFIRGGWLELYSVPILDRLRDETKIRDYSLNLLVDSPKKVANELDVAFTARNRLHIVECKSGKMKASKETRVDSIIYKLDNLRDLIGGDYGKAMLMSYWGLDDSDRRRLTENSIQFIEGRGLLDLEKRLRGWVS